MRFVRGDEGGQATIEFALVLPPILLMLVFGMIELGSALSTNLTLAAAAREGARIAGGLANGGGTLGCGAGQSPNWTTVDPQVVAAVERVLTSSGSLVTVSDTQQIWIWKSDAAGNQTAQRNVWTYSLNAGPTVDGQPLDFVQGSVNWQACARVNTLPPDSAGVTIVYTYRARTPLRFLVPGLATINMTDRAVFTLNATR
jgi:Flp pilus assembly protein TadG